MRRRQGFTIIELLVSMALIVFIMVILTEAFAAGMATFRQLKAIGDMQERLRTAAIAIRRDLQMTHVTRDGKPMKLGDMKLNRAGEPFDGYEPPDEGYFRIWQVWHEGSTAGSQPNPNIPPAPNTVFDRIRLIHNSTWEGDEALVPAGLAPSYRATTHVLQFTCMRSGSARENFCTAPVQPGSPLEVQGPAAYQTTNNPAAQLPHVLNSRWSEVTLFLRPNLNGERAGGITPLYTLYRREKAVSMKYDGAPHEITPSPSPPPPYLTDLSFYPSGGKDYANLPSDLTDPRHRFKMDTNDKSYPGIPVGYPNWTLADTLGANNGRAGDEALVTDVISFDVKVIQQGWDPSDRGTPLDSAPWGVIDRSKGVCGQWVDLPPSPLSRNPYFNDQTVNRYWSVYDTWCRSGDPYQRDLGFSPVKEGWNENNTLYSMPLRIRILAIQITIRIWDQKSEQTRQVTIVQDMCS